jgi:hypothetical protein
VAQAVTCAAFLGQSTTAASATWAVATSDIRTATINNKSRDGRGWVISGGQCRSREFLVHVLSQVEDVDHHFVRGEELVGVERIDDTLVGMAEVADA